MVHGRHIVYPKPGQIAKIDPREEAVFGAMPKEDASALKSYMRDWPDAVNIVQGYGVNAYHGSTNNNLVLEDRGIYLAANIRYTFNYTGSNGSVYHTSIKPGTILLNLDKAGVIGPFIVRGNGINGFWLADPNQGGACYHIFSTDRLTVLRKVASLKTD